MQLNYTITWHKLLFICLLTFAAGISKGFGQNTAEVDTTIDIGFAALSDSLPVIHAPDLVSYPFPKKRSRLFHVALNEERIVVNRDSAGRYISRRMLNGIPLALPYVMNFEEYARRSLEESKRENWNNLITRYESNREERRGLLDFRFDVPGGRESTFTTIFGKPEVNLRVNGTANMNLGASIQKTENPELPPDQQTQIDPTFEQSLKLNIQGTIGDKLSIQTDWDTEAAFDFQNRLSIVYQGYEDEILQRIEMGNVSMETGNSLIRGGSALFGIKSIAQIGSLRLTSVVSQQEGEGQTETLTGGAQEQQLSIRPADYENDRHFFLDFFNRQQFEQNMSNPQQLGQAYQLSEINVWILRESTQSFEGERQAIALVDLGVNETNGTFGLPNEEDDPFTDATLDNFRDPSIGTSATDFGVNADEFVEGYFIPLQEGVDYEVNRYLGYLSLKRNLGSRQALAISFKYLDPQTGQTVSVGDVSQGGGSRIYLKLLRPQNATTTNKAWDLMMKNIYSLGASNLTPEGTEVDIKYTQENVPSSSLPQRTNILLQDLGLDRVDSQGALSPDNRIDFSTGTLDPATGKIIFPYLQPFGSRIEELLQDTGLPVSEINSIVFNELYNEKKVNANQFSKNNFFLIEGSSKGTTSGSYSLDFGLVEGSVKVFANGRELTEGTDYVVDYSIGSITILDEQYLKKGQEIKIEYEKNQFAQIEQKNFTGLRAEYEFTDNIRLGSTFFKLKEKPLQDKIRIGDEPVNNTVVGLDANARFDLPWLTRAIDKVPLLQTNAPSSFSMSGEFAQLRPGVAQTNAVSDAIDRNELFEDEENGLSFIDDFEGVDITLNFTNASRWNLAAAPAAVPGYAPDQPFFGNDPLANPSLTLNDKIARSDLRSQFSWYSIPRNIVDILGGVQLTPETQPVRVTDVFPNRDVLSEENFITTLDVYYNPENRGPYNYNLDLRNLLENDQDRTWGGMVTTVPSGQEDLTQNNIEFLEFWVQPILPDGREPTAQDLADYDGKMYIDIGIVSEDIVPNFKTNTEDGLTRRPEDLQLDNLGADSRSYIAVPPPPPEGQFANDRRAQEDVGLDGAPNTGGIDGKNEQELFNSFINAMEAAYGAGSETFQQIQDDPSNDDYIYYGEDQVSELTLQNRFHRLYGYHDGNTPPNNSGDKRAVTNKPDTEGLITPSIVEQNNSYFQYEIDWNPADFSQLDVGQPGTFIVDKVPGSRQQDRWYQVRIPLQDWIRKVGSIENFQNISYIRVWLSGYEKPFTMRFATFELVGSQWRNADDVDQQQTSQADFSISSVNIEENSRRLPIPYRQPEGAIRATNRSRQRQTIANEQSLILDVENLGSEELKMVKRVYPGGLNMINYSNVRMFVHGEGFENRGDAELVMRFGTDLINNYYEYRQPISPTDPNYPFSNQPLDELTEAEREQEAEQVWLYNENSVNILLRIFNQLKQLRDQQQDDPSAVYERSDIVREAPEGAVVAIKGNPSLDRIGEIGMGIRNPFDPGAPQQGVQSLDAQLWLNELRVSGFDNQNGWAANAKAELQLADFASINANVTQETDGFGALNSRLGQRRVSDIFGYDINTTVNLHKFLPDRYGWNFPVSLSTRSSTSTPRYLPNQGDVRLSEFEDAVQARDDINEDQKQNIIDQRIQESQTFMESYSVNVSNVSKRLSESNFLQYTLDKTTLNFVFNTTDRRSPEYVFQDNWNYSGSLRYNVNFQNTLLFRPFGFLGDVPLLDVLSGLKLGYTPASINASFGVNREYDERRRRTIDGQSLASLQQSHTFNYNTNFGFGYNLTPSIKTTFQTRTIFDLSRAGIEQIGQAGTVDSTEFRVIPTFTVFDKLITDTLSSRRSNYEEAYTAGWQPRLNSIDALSWISYSANYGGGYQWRNSPAGSELGATISNNLSLNQSLDFDFSDLFNRMDWYRRLTEERTRNSDRSVSDTTGSGGPDQNVGRILRKGLMALLSIQSLDFSFNISKNSLQSGYAGDSQLYYMFKDSENNFSPPFSYRTGFTDEIGFTRLIDNPDLNTSIQLPSNKRFSDDLTASSRFQPFKNFTVDLTFNTQWDVTKTRSITIDPSESVSTVRTQSGNISSSVWAFGKGYGELFRKQLQTAFDDINAANDSLSDAAGNGDGETVLGKRSLEDDFRQAYLGVSTTGIGSRNFTPFPLPGWKVTWTGLERFIPYFGNFMARATLNHAYSGRYRLGWTFNADTSPLQPFNLGVYTVANNRSDFEPNAINIEKRFVPLIGLNITWQSNLRTNLQYEVSKVTSLALSNSTVTERLSRGLQFSFSYTIRNFKLPFFPRLDNAVDFTLNASYIEDTEQKFILDSDLDNALQVGHENINKDVDAYDFTESFTEGQSRVNGSAIIGYQFSQTIKANFEYTYRQIIPQSSLVFPRIDHDLLFNIIVSIRSN